MGFPTFLNEPFSTHIEFKGKRYKDIRSYCYTVEQYEQIKEIKFK